MKPGPYKTKRALDLLLGTLLLLVTLPVTAAVFLGLVLKKKPPLRWTDSTGRNGVPFSRPVLNVSPALFKNRSAGRLLTNLPSLVLVLKGKMSLVGPSPHHFRKHLFLGTRFEGYEGRLQCAPGLVSPASLAPRPCSEKLSLHIEILYCKKASPWFDLWLVARTLWRLGA